MKIQKSTMPEKTREFQNHHFDSTMWNDFIFRDDDIVISTYGKSGTTWVQQILGQLIFNGSEDVEVASLSPWVDLRVPPKEVKIPELENQTNRRFMKTHLPVDALVFSPKAKYIFVGRDGRDILWSFYHHHTTANQLWYDTLNDTPNRVGPPIGKPSESIVDYFTEWLENDGHPLWPYFSHLKSWWNIRELPNVYFMHFSNLKADMELEIKKLAQFLNIPMSHDKWEDIIAHCTFNYMKKNAMKSVPLGGAFWEGGASTFIYKGTNGRWKDILSKEQNDRYVSLLLEKCGEKCADWIMYGTK